MKKIISVFILLAILICGVSAAQKADITEKYKQLKPSFFELEPYVEKPISGEGWTAGSLKSGFVADGVNFINFCRFVADLDEISYNGDNEENMQKAALLYSAAVFSDDKTIPPYMNADFYNAAYGALKNSLTAFGFDTLDMSVQGLINSRGENMTHVIPRTTLLSPFAKSVEMGYFDGYSTVAVNKSESASDYEYIAWPADGDFPTMLYKENLPWTITLNPEKYIIPDASGIMVRMRNNKLKTSMDLKAGEGYSYYNSDAVYVGVNPDTNTVIFKPDATQMALWNVYDEYDIQVTLFGITTAEGEETSIEYMVKLFDLQKAVIDSYSDKDTVSSFRKSAIAELSASGVFMGYPDGTFRPDEKITRAEFTTALLRYMGIQPSENAETVFSDVTSDHWAKGYIEKAAEIGAVNGTDPGIFSPEDIVTAEQAMKIVTIVKGFAEKMNVEASGGYPLAYYNLGLEVGLLDGVDENETFDYQLTRADVAQILYNSSQVTKFWVEKQGEKTIVWHRDRTGKGYGYYSFVKFGAA